MKNIFTLLIIAGLLTGLNSCGGSETKTESVATSLPYYISIADAEGNDVMVDGKRCNFGGDGITGEVNFGFDGGSLKVLDCWNKVDDGVESFEGKVFKGSVSIKDYTVDGVDVTISKVTKTKEDSMGAYYDLTGTIAGATKGKFNVSVFIM